MMVEIGKYTCCDEIGGAQAEMLPDPAPGQGTDDRSNVESGGHESHHPGRRELPPGCGHIGIQGSGNEGGQAIQQHANNEHRQRSRQGHHRGGNQAGRPGGDQQRLPTDPVCQVTGRDVGDHHRGPKGREYRCDGHGARPELGHIDGLENKEHALADPPGEEAGKEQDQGHIHAPVTRLTNCAAALKTTWRVGSSVITCPPPSTHSICLSRLPSAAWIFSMLSRMT